ncbi:MAG: helix-turn-helix transcriptional regulator [Melioribacteraceae bacterium]|nr:helix-turn-helix transcriptional regulator [Melioribacteraceae bacterium]
MDRQEEIKSLISSLGIKQSYIAEKLGIKKQTLSYLLNESTKFDDELYDKLKEIIDDFQFEFSFIGEEKDDNYDLFDEAKLRLGIGQRIRMFAKRKYGTLKNLADEMEISPQQLQQYISGKREPGSKVLVKLLKLGCDINWLLGGSESIESYRIYKLETEIKKFHSGLGQINTIINKLDYHKHN